MNKEDMHEQLSKLELYHYVICAMWSFAAIVFLCINILNISKDRWLAVLTLVAVLLAYMKFKSASSFGATKKLYRIDEPNTQIKKQFCFTDKNNRLILKNEAFYIQKITDENNNLLKDSEIKELNDSDFISNLLMWSDKVRVVNKDYAVNIKIGHKVVGVISPTEVKFYDKVLAKDTDALQVWKALTISTRMEN